MTARATYVSSVATAVATEVASKVVATATQQEAINASGVNVGYTPCNPTKSGATFASFQTALTNAVKANVAAVQLAAMVSQVAQSSAKDTLRSTGDKDIA